MKKMAIKIPRNLLTEQLEIYSQQIKKREQKFGGLAGYYNMLWSWAPLSHSAPASLVPPAPLVALQQFVTELGFGSNQQKYLDPQQLYFLFVQLFKWGKYPKAPQGEDAACFEKIREKLKAGFMLPAEAPIFWDLLCRLEELNLFDLKFAEKLLFDAEDLYEVQSTTETGDEEGFCVVVSDEELDNKRKNIKPSSGVKNFIAIVQHDQFEPLIEVLSIFVQYVGLWRMEVRNEIFLEILAHRDLEKLKAEVKLDEYDNLDLPSFLDSSTTWKERLYKTNPPPEADDYDDPEDDNLTITSCMLSELEKIIFLDKGTLSDEEALLDEEVDQTNSYYKNNATDTSKTTGNIIDGEDCLTEARFFSGQSSFLADRNFLFSKASDTKKFPENGGNAACSWDSQYPGPYDAACDPPAYSSDALKRSNTYN